MDKVVSKMKFGIFLFLFSLSLSSLKLSASPICVSTNQHTIQTAFAKFYNLNHRPQTYDNLKSAFNILAFDCGYFYIVETAAKPQVFGAEHAYFFSKKTFEHLGSVLRE